jgi:hypothetical protein
VTAPTAPAHLRADQPLHEQLTAIASAEGKALKAYLQDLIRADVPRRQRLAASVRLDWRATDAELADALSTAVATPLSDIEQHGLKGLTPEQAVGYAAARSAKKRSSKPAPSPGTKPGAAPPRQRASAAPAPAKSQTRSAVKAPKTLTSAHADQLRALAPHLGVSTQQLISHALDRIGPYGKYTKGIDVRVAIAVDDVLGLRGGR